MCAVALRAPAPKVVTVPRSAASTRAPEPVADLAVEGGLGAKPNRTVASVLGRAGRPEPERKYGFDAVVRRVGHAVLSAGFCAHTRTVP